MFIEVRGSQRIESDTIKSYMTVKPGDLYDDAEVDRSLKILFNTGLFADVAIRYENSGLILNQRPYRPSTEDLHKNGKHFPPNFLHKSWMDYLYWDVELEP